MKLIKLVFEDFDIVIDKNGSVEYNDGNAEIYWGTTVNACRTEFAEVQLKSIYEEYEKMDLINPNISIIDWLNVRRLIVEASEML
ncbi:hypothetical protein CkP1_0062 [Citrobacter phage CkP1]|nr:hypothetical protein CkP1_0062 [Citrobacter phage CkP1]